MWISGDEVLRAAMQVGEVATPAAGDQNLFADALGVLQHRHVPTALARFDSAHQTGRTAAENQHIQVALHRLQFQVSSFGMQVRRKRSVLLYASSLRCNPPRCDAREARISVASSVSLSLAYASTCL